MQNEAQLDQLCINTLRTLSIDAVENAKSGHPGTPMGAAATVYCLWQDFLRYDPEHPEWPNRDRFVLSAGHASALLYSLLHLCGVKAMDKDGKLQNQPAVALEDLKHFRQLGSRCTGHPEYGWTTGVETTTGPLGQGVAVSVGMAIASRWLAATYNRPDGELFDFNVYALCSDGDVMEGICSEAASLAGHLGLANLCWIYDDNCISIEGSTSLTFSEDVPGRFASQGWNVVRVDDANDLDALRRAYRLFLNTHDGPTLIIVRSHIGYGAPSKQDSKDAHGEALGPEEVRLAKKFYGWNPDAQFYVPDEVPACFRDRVGRRGKEAHATWSQAFASYRQRFPELAAQIEHMQARTLPDGWDSGLPMFPADVKGMATRESSGKVLNALAAKVPWLLGGAADLAPSTKTLLTFESAGHFQAPGRGGDYRGRNFHFGLREHAMCGIAAGMTLSKLRAYAASFFIFTDYCRTPIRLSAMMELPVIYIWTHDSILLGEDGPTHQPVEQLASFRAMPGMILLRPADANEVVEAWRVIMTIKHTPVSLVLTRQTVATLDRRQYASAAGLARGAYVLADASEGQPEVLLMATGSEVALCAAAYEQLREQGVKVRLVSMPSWELFEQQDPAYRDSVLPPQVLGRVAVEAASPFGWERYAGGGAVLGVDSFGASAPAKAMAEHFGFSIERIVAAVKAQAAGRPHSLLPNDAEGIPT